MKCLGSHGYIGYTDALRKSCNIYFANLAVATGQEQMIQTALDCGFGSRTGIDLFGEVPGIIPTEKWLKKYGPGRAIVLARYVPFVRTLINPLCGIVRVPASTFFIWNVVGGILWTDGIILLGFLLGEKLKGSIDKYLLPVIFLIIILSLLPLALQIFREVRTKRHLS